MSARLRALVAVVLGASAFFGLAPAAQAHAELLGTSPANGAQLDTAPSSIVLEFSEPVSISEIQLVDAADDAAELGEAVSSDGTVTIGVPSLDDGGYVLTWQLVSEDGHPLTGSLVFAIGESALPPIGATGSDPSLAGGWSLAQAAARFAQYSGFLIALGLWAFVVFCWWPGHLGSRSRRLVLFAAVLGVAGSFARLGLQPGYTGTSLGDVVRSTTGQGWIMSAAACGLLAVLASSRPDDTARSMHAGALGLCWGLGGWAIAAGGHGASGRQPVLGLVTTVVHVGAAAVWIGGLVGLVVFLRSAEPDRGTAARFSRLALCAVVVIVASGIAQGLRQLTTREALLESDFGRVLIVKALIVTALVALGGLSRHIVSRGELALADHDQVRRWPWQTALPRTVTIELACAALALIATGLLAGASPLVAVASNPQQFDLTSDGRTATVWIGPAVTGSNEMHVTVTSPDGSAPDEITASVAPADGLSPAIDIPVASAGASHVISSPFVIPTSGTWVVRVQARFGEFTSVGFSGDFEVIPR